MPCLYIHSSRMSLGQRTVNAAKAHFLMTSLLAVRSNQVDPGQDRQAMRRKVLRSNTCQIAKTTTTTSEAHQL
jgi:hypothetical protein